MKIKIYASAIAIAFCAACQSNLPPEIVGFSFPQPTHAQTLNEIPKGFRGVYTLGKDSTHLIILANTICFRYSDSSMCLKNEISPNIKIHKDSTAITKEGYFLGRITIRNDTLIFPFRFDTLYHKEKSYLVKFFKSKLYINHRVNDSWFVTELGLHNHQLSICSPDSASIKFLLSNSKAALDSLPYNFQLNQRQFKELLKANGFASCDTFTKSIHQ